MFVYVYMICMMLKILMCAHVTYDTYDAIGFMRS